MNLVLDTNVLIAAFLTRGVCHDLLEHCQRDHQLVTSEFILTEFEEKLHSKFQIPKDSIQQATALLRSYMQVVTPSPLPSPVCRDADDGYLGLHWQATATASLRVTRICSKYSIIKTSLSYPLASSGLMRQSSKKTEIFSLIARVHPPFCH